MFATAFCIVTGRYKADVEEKAAEWSRSGACGVPIPAFDNIQKALHVCSHAAEHNDADIVADIAGTFNTDTSDDDV